MAATQGAINYHYYHIKITKGLITSSQLSLGNQHNLITNML